MVPTPALSAALLALAKELPPGCGFALVVVMPPLESGRRACHICEHNLDDEGARELGSECLLRPELAASAGRVEH